MSYTYVHDYTCITLYNQLDMIFDDIWINLDCLTIHGY